MDAEDDVVDELGLDTQESRQQKWDKIKALEQERRRRLSASMGMVVASEAGRPGSSRPRRVSKDTNAATSSTAAFARPAEEPELATPAPQQVTMAGDARLVKVHGSSAGSSKSTPSSSRAESSQRKSTEKEAGSAPKTPATNGGSAAEKMKSLGIADSYDPNAEEEEEEEVVAAKPEPTKTSSKSKPNNTNTGPSSSSSASARPASAESDSPPPSVSEDSKPSGSRAESAEKRESSAPVAPVNIPAALLPSAEPAPSPIPSLGVRTSVPGAVPRKSLTDQAAVDAFIDRPAPLGVKYLCKIVRRKDGFDKFYPQYELYLEEPDGTKTFLLAARKRKKSKASHYLISSSRNIVRGSSIIRGQVKSNFIGTEFTINDNGECPFDRDTSESPTKDANGNTLVRQDVAGVIYEQNILGLKGPRRMTVLLPGMSKQGERLELRPVHEKEAILEKYKAANNQDLLVLHNKSPQWNEETRSYVLNFAGRVTMASVKNFQIVHDNDLDYVLMQFGRVSEDTFTMDYQYPMSALQAFGIALSSFDSKLACE